MCPTTTSVGPDTSHTPTHGLQFTKFGSLHEEYNGLAYVPV